MKEKKNLEFKSTITNTFLKTVSAYSNFGDGEIWFGINDDGSVCGIEHPETVCIDIENRINDSISPKPKFEMRVDTSKNIICLTVREGAYKPYLYKGKAYRRSDTTSVEVDQAELKSLVLEGSNLYFEELPSEKQTLRFEELSKKLIEKLEIQVVSEDVLRTLGFFTKNREYNNAAALLSDENRFYGIDMARFGSSINEIMDRETFSHMSILKQYDAAVNMIKRYYQYEEINEIERKKVDLIPETAYREAIANALVHRDWSIPAHIRILMFKDRIEIKSPGGLPKGITADEYLNGEISCLRNPILGNLFFRLQYIEMFGTGIRRIQYSYRNALIKPKFEVNMIKRYYQYEEINEIERKKVDLIPETAYREAIANALVHRDWSIPAHIRILMFKDRIEIKSPGGLPKGITADEYLNGEISCLRNPILGNLFFRLQYIEMFGTGIRRIQYSYRNALIKPKFEVTDNVISVVLPVLNSQYQVTSDERKIINELGQGGQLSSSEIAKRTGMKKSKTLRLIEHLKEKGYVRVTGNGRGTKYTL